MATPRGSTAAELDAPSRRALQRLAREVPAGASAAVARGRQRVSSALDHATPGHDRQPSHPPGQTSRRTPADAGHSEPRSLISSTRGPATATKRPFGRWPSDQPSATGLIAAIGGRWPGACRCTLLSAETAASCPDLLRHMRHAEADVLAQGSDAGLGRLVDRSPDLKLGPTQRGPPRKQSVKGQQRPRDLPAPTRRYLNPVFGPSPRGPHRQQAVAAAIRYGHHRLMDLVEASTRYPVREAGLGGVPG
jgi:hypothetical protein